MSMRIVILGRTLSSSWASGEATTWRALVSALAARGHKVLFLERDDPALAAHRDLPDPDFCELRLYGGLGELAAWRSAMGNADLVMLGSGTLDGIAVGRFIQRHAGGVSAFYDLATPTTLAALRAGTATDISADLIPGFDLYFSTTGGPTLRRLTGEFGARAAHALYCSVDPARHARSDVPEAWDIGYLGSWSADRQDRLERLLIEPARRNPGLRCVVAGAMCPPGIDWPANVTRFDHLAPAAHADFFSALGWALNLTRAEMIAAGYSPGVRLFEAASCGCPILTDAWVGLDELFRPEIELRVVACTADVEAALALDRAARRQIGEAGRRRVLAEHTSWQRAMALEAWVAQASPGGRATKAGKVAGELA